MSDSSRNRNRGSKHREEGKSESEKINYTLASLSLSRPPASLLGFPAAVCLHSGDRRTDTLHESVHVDTRVCTRGERESVCVCVRERESDNANAKCNGTGAREERR